MLRFPSSPPPLFPSTYYLLFLYLTLRQCCYSSVAPSVRTCPPRKGLVLTPFLAYIHFLLPSFFSLFLSFFLLSCRPRLLRLQVSRVRYDDHCAFFKVNYVTCHILSTNCDMCTYMTVTCDSMTVTV